MSTGGRVMVVYDEKNSHNLDGKLTVPVAVICIAVAFCGFIYGYDSGATGQVSKNIAFLKYFFPTIANKMMKSGKMDEFCMFNTREMLMYMSGMHVAAVFSAFMSGYLTTSAGRKGALVIGSVIYTIGAAIQASAVRVEMLILGRLIIGFGLGFTTQASPMYMTEMAPTKWRGAFGSGFQLFFSLGLLAAFILNHYVNVNPNPNPNPKFGDNTWRIVLGFSALPGTIITIAAAFMPDTPTSLIQRGKLQEALESLKQVRSNEVDSENELKSLIKYNEGVKKTSCENPYHILLERKYRPHLVLAIGIPTLQHLTGAFTSANLQVMLFKTIGLSVHKMFVTTLIMTLVITLGVFVSILLIDRVGRRMLLLQGSVQIVICHLVLGILLTNGNLSQERAILASLIILCISVTFTWSWGPMPWIIPSEILPIEVRPTGHGLLSAFHFGIKFIVYQITVPLICRLKYGMPFCYVVSGLLVITLIALFVPETKRIPLESMDKIWHNHWYWRRFVGEL